MMCLSCEREQELAELLHHGHWPQACNPDLHAHVAQCRSCSELVLIAQSFQVMRKHALVASPAASSGALWWRAQLRRRNQAVERISKPIAGAQLFAFTVVLFLAVAATMWAATHGANTVAWLQNIARALKISAFLPEPFPESVGSFWWIVPVLATLALISGIVVYLASEKE